MGTYKTVKIPPELKTKLDGLKVHEREPYAEVIERTVMAFQAIKMLWKMSPPEMRGQVRKDLGDETYEKFERFLV